MLWWRSVRLTKSQTKGGEVRNQTGRLDVRGSELLIRCILQTGFSLESRRKHQFPLALGRMGIFDEEGRVAGISSSGELERVHTGTAAELAG